MKFNIPDTDQKRVVVVGAGFAGLNFARRIAKDRSFQVVLLDRNNYHTFQPLIYQVATSGLEPSGVAFPLRKLFQGRENVFVHAVEVQGVDTRSRTVLTNIGPLRYNYLVLAQGVATNWYGHESLRRHAIPMKSLAEAMYLRNTILEDYERALTVESPSERQRLLNIAIVGGGPTGVELAGALAEMRRQIIPKEYRGLSSKDIKIHVLDAAPRLLHAMSPAASEAAEKALRQLGVSIWLDSKVSDYDGGTLRLADGCTIQSSKVIWAAGITGQVLPGLERASIQRGNRLKVNAFNEMENYPGVFVLGDLAWQHEERYPEGHPQVAQVAIQQGKLLAANLIRLRKKQALRPFRYFDFGTMAVIGRSRAVGDLPWGFWKGRVAWLAWVFIHLAYLIGPKNRIMVLINWIWHYITCDQPLRLVLRPWQRESNQRLYADQKSAVNGARFTSSL